MMAPENALELARMLGRVEDVLHEKYTQWREKNKRSDPEVLAIMDNTHNLVIDYMYGMCSDDVKPVLEQLLKKEACHEKEER